MYSGWNSSFYEWLGVYFVLQYRRVLFADVNFAPGDVTWIASGGSLLKSWYYHVYCRQQRRRDSLLFVANRSLFSLLPGILTYLFKLWTERRTERYLRSFGFPWKVKITKPCLSTVSSSGWPTPSRTIHCKIKVSPFFRPQSVCHLPNSLWSGIISLFPSRESLECHPGWRAGKRLTFFYSTYVASFFVVINELYAKAEISTGTEWVLKITYRICFSSADSVSLLMRKPVF
jgi:hypothetical protein